MTPTLSRVLLGALVLTSAACSDPATAPRDASELTPQEARTLAFGVTAAGSDYVEGLAWDDGSAASASFATAAGSGVVAQSPGGPGPMGGPGGGWGWGLWWGRHRPGIHGTTTTTVERTMPCPQAGTTRRVTKITSTVDTVARRGTLSTESTETPSQCAFTVDSLNAVLTTIAQPRTVITITGTPSLVTKTSSSYTWSPPPGSNGRGRLTRNPVTGTTTGSFTYTTSDNRSGTCQVDLAMTADPNTRTHTLKGSFCGQTINFTHTRGLGRGPMH